MSGQSGSKHIDKELQHLELQLSSNLEYEFNRLERSNRALKAQLKTTKAVIQTRDEEITQQRQQIDHLCAAEISKKEMHKIICDQAQVITELLRDGKEITGD
jgi:hypothetical protein